jgi:hypothetical protein
LSPSRLARVQSAAEPVDQGEAAHRDEGSPQERAEDRQETPGSGLGGTCLATDVLVASWCRECRGGCRRFRLRAAAWFAPAILFHRGAVAHQRRRIRGGDALAGVHDLQSASDLCRVRARFWVLS